MFSPFLEIIMFIRPDKEEVGLFIKKKIGIITIRKTSFSQTASLISRGAYFLNTDSGLGYIASCFDCQIFTIFDPTDSRLTKSLSKHSIIIKTNLECQPCEKQNPSNFNKQCLNTFTTNSSNNVINQVINNK